MSNLVKMEGIDKSFPGVHALKSVDFSVRAGEVHALMGENGAGKSTLMKVLTGIYRSDKGRIFIDGKESQIDSPKKAQNLGIGIVHQELALMHDLTVGQNIWIGREPRSSFGRINERKLNSKTVDIFKEMNISMDPSQPVEELTIARQQMVEIAKALSYRSRVLIMDEPTAALTNSEIAELFRIVEKLKAEGTGIVYISHKMDEIKKISDRVTIMRDGALVDTVHTDSTSIAEIITMMVGRELDHDHIKIPELQDSEPALEVRNLSQGTVLNDISFNLKKGEILGFAGLMGAGRTELARAIFGAEPPTSGEILIDGKLVNIRTPAHAVRESMGYLSEDRKKFGLLLSMNVRTNIAMASLSDFANKIGLIKERKISQIAKDYIAKLNIRTPSDEQEVGLLSGGNQQKVVIAKWLLRDCKILLFDEPTRGIDIGAKMEIYRLLDDLAAQGKSIIMISSELPEILRISHRIAVICEGRLTGILPRGASQEDIMTLATQREAMVAQ